MGISRCTQTLFQYLSWSDLLPGEAPSPLKDVVPRGHQEFQKTVSWVYVTISYSEVKW